MDNKEYLNEEQYQKNNAKVKGVGKTLLIIGIVILILGIILIIVGWLGIGKTASDGIGTFGSSYDMNSITSSMQQTTSSAFGNIGLFAIGGFIDTIGFLLIVAGGITMFIAHRREITAYTIQQTMPIAQEGINKMAPTIGNAAGTIAQGITKGIKEGLKDEEK